jgi:hypothetical protein
MGEGEAVMGLAKKGSRRIRVGESNYRWVVSPSDGCMEVVVGLDPERGRRLVVVTSYHYEVIPASGGMIRPKAQIGPAFVAKCITTATAMGWDPRSAAGESFRLIETDGQFVRPTIRTVK